MSRKRITKREMLDAMTNAIATAELMLQYDVGKERIAAGDIVREKRRIEALKAVYNIICSHGT